MHQGVSFAMFHVTKIDEAVAFYTEKLGFTIDSRAGGFAQFAHDGNGAIFALSEEKVTTPNSTELWWFVDDADAIHAELAAKGVTIVDAPHDEPFGRAFSIKDPSGNMLYLLKVAQG